jgi:hypothetical protein
MMQDPEALEKIMNGKKQAEEMSAAQASASSKVPFFFNTSSFFWRLCK